MPEPRTEVITAPLDVLGERLSELRLCDAGALVAMQRSLEQYGQLTSLLLLSVPATETSSEQLEIIDGFKRVRAARALGWPTLAARVIATDSVDAKLRLRQLHDGRGFTELEEAWLVRSLHRDDGLAQSYIARLLHRHKSWVWRRLMLVESLERSVSSDVRLGLIAPRAAVAVSRLPRGNQLAASAVVMRRGLTVRQTDRLVSDALDEPDEHARARLLRERLDGPAPHTPPGPRPSRAPRSDADVMSADILHLSQLAARLEAHLASSTLAVLTPGAAELLIEALVHLLPVLRALDAMIASATRRETA